MNAYSNPKVMTAELDIKQTQPTYCARNMIPAGSCATIMLDGQAYTLRITRSGKLILTK